MRTRRNDAQRLAALICTVLAAAGCRRSHPIAGPNLLLITLDTVRADRLGSYGDAGAETPNLDRLAREGVRFSTVDTVAPLTLPAHATILSGLLPTHHGVHGNSGNRFPDEIPTLATRLSAAGYDTAAFVGSFVLDHRFGLARGFARYDDDIPRPPEGGNLAAERSGAAVVDLALAWLGESRTRPFFVWVHLYDAHAPYNPAEPWRSRHASDLYRGEIAAVDAQVGRLLDALSSGSENSSNPAKSAASQTLIAVIADHGEGLGEHGELTHGLLLYEPSLHVPLILRAPGALPADRTIRTAVSSADLAPTLLGLLGLADGFASAVDGRDLSSSLLLGTEPAAADIYAETEYPELFGWAPLYALRRGDRKLIAGPEPELYDLSADPLENGNRFAADPRGASHLETSLAGLRNPSQTTVPTAQVTSDAETRARLQSLGYASGSSVRPTPGSPEIAPNPMKMVPLFRRYEDARSTREAGRPAEAAVAFAALAVEDPFNPVFQSALGGALRASGAVAKSLDSYRRAVALTPDDAEAWYNLAVTLRESGRPEESLKALRETLRLSPTYAEAENALGIAFSISGNNTEALEAFAHTVALDPRNATAQNNLGNALRAANRVEEAKAAYRRAIELAPDYADALNGLGVLEVAGGRAAAGLPLLDRALALSPGGHEIRLNRAVALEMLGERQQAAAAYQDFLIASASDPQFSAQRGAVRARLAGLARPKEQSRSPTGERR
ncbi:MAG: sulfatase-like hydrolase/transferase [Thermoanaerobaculia bacterium]